MTKFLMKATLSAAFALAAFAVPGQASPVLNFSFSGLPNGPMGETGGTVTSLSTGSFLNMSVSGAGQYNGTWVFSSSSFLWNSASDSYTLTVTGTATCAACGTGTLGNNPTGISFGANPILTINLATPPTLTNIGGSNPNQTGTVQINNATSITESATLLTDLGLSVPSSTVLNAGDAISFNKGTVSGGVGTFTAGSGVLAVTLTPEPMSFMLLGSGLFLVGFIARKRAVRPAAIVIGQ